MFGCRVLEQTADNSIAWVLAIEDSTTPDLELVLCLITCRRSPLFDMCFATGCPKTRHGGTGAYLVFAELSALLALALSAWAERAINSLKIFSSQKASSTAISIMDGTSASAHFMRTLFVFLSTEVAPIYHTKQVLTLRLPASTTGMSFRSILSCSCFSRTSSFKACGTCSKVRASITAKGSCWV